MLNRMTVIEGDITKQEVDAIVNAANETLLGGGGVDWVIHTVGPVWKIGPVSEIGTRREDELLARCYRNSLTLAQQYKIRTIAFPAISTGLFCFPIDRAAKIAVSEVKQFLANYSSIDQVILVCFGPSAYQCYLNAAQDIA